MNHFPVSHSNLSASHLGRFVAERYGLQDVQCRLIRSGINDTYAVDSASGKFVFRVYSLNWRTEKEIHEEIRLLQELYTQGISVSYALPDLGETTCIPCRLPRGAVRHLVYVGKRRKSPFPLCRSASQRGAIDGTVSRSRLGTRTGSGSIHAHGFASGFVGKNQGVFARMRRTTLPGTAIRN